MDIVLWHFIDCSMSVLGDIEAITRHHASHSTHESLHFTASNWKFLIYHRLFSSCPLNCVPELITPILCAFGFVFQTGHDRVAEVSDGLVFSAQ